MSRLAILWHLHQPDYRDPRSGRPMSPWVRLHAIRGYRDLCADIERDEVRATVNVVPSLLDQLAWYAAGGDDPHLALMSIPAEDLRPDAISEITSSFVAGHPALIGANLAWARLAARVRAGDALDVADLRDVQVWSVLAWFGATAIRDFPALGALRAQGSGFTEADKAVVLSAQASILCEFPAWFQRVARVATVSTSPYFHPILPLLIDSRHALRCLPRLSPADDAGFRWPGDALEQCTRARDRVGGILGRPPLGLWPSEGSVSPEVVEIAAHAGFRWLATDDGVLARSDADSPRRRGGFDLGNGVIGFFRDHDLSDRIGFDAVRHPPVPFARKLVAEAASRAAGGVTVLALDGENPWEAFADAGHAFREALHDAMRSSAVTLDDASRETPVGRVRRLHTGSWINADFKIWYGHPDDRRAWRLVADARRAIDEAPPALRSAALDKLLPAEGSDWTWWYGDDFHTPFLPAFDAAFRRHLRATWEALGRTPPPELDKPVSAAVFGTDDADVAPQRAAIAPVLEADPAWIRWSGAGVLRPMRGSSMSRGAAVIEEVRFGRADDDAVWLWVRFPDDRPAGEVWRIQLNDREVTIAVGAATAEAHASARGIVVRMRVAGERVEVAIEGDSARLPASGTAALPLPPARARAAWWVV